VVNDLQATPFALHFVNAARVFEVREKRNCLLKETYKVAENRTVKF